ncbi:MAG: hypothetical protein JRG76_16450 [Deltaproteobacteria bacterium]|nr:hypothetical protein [Deltaproteobacteria bacterium]MBW2416090.1 hypothetical protein [Deltaproteobacteria bacterium]
MTTHETSTGHEQPWLARDDWASGRIRSSEGPAAVIAWVFAVAFTGGSIPLVGFGLDAFPERLGEAAFAFVFPAAALGMWYWAAIATARWRRFRRVVLELDTRPGVIGGTLAGAIHTGTAISPDAYRLVLSCVRIRRAGKNTNSDTLWQGECDLPGTRAGRGHSGTRVPFSFEIPYELPSSMVEPVTAGRAREQIVWQLHAGAELAGADLASVFEVPVYKTGESDPQVTERIGEHTPDAPDSDVEPSEESSVRSRRLPEGGLELYFAAARNKAGGIAIILFTLAWNAFVGFAALQLPGFAKLMLIPFGGVGLLLLGFVPVVWLQRTTVHARPGRLDVRTRTFGRGRTREYRLDEIDSIAAEIRGRNGRNPLWAIRIHLKHGKPRSAGGDLRSKPQAQRLAAAIWRELSGGR